MAALQIDSFVWRPYKGIPFVAALERDSFGGGLTKGFLLWRPYREIPFEAASLPFCGGLTKGFLLWRP